MSGETLPSTVSSTMDNLFSPAGLFFLLNLMIASIAISSRLSSSSSNDHGTSEHDDRYQQQQEQGEEEQTPSNSSSDTPTDTEPLSRSPSLLGRFRLFDIGRSGMPHQEQEPAEPEHEQETERQLDNDDQSYEEISRSMRADDAREETRDTEVQSRMRRSWSIKSDSGQYQRAGESSGEEEEVVERRRPATARDLREGDEEVDAKADDFINRFKQQLRLQRIESLTRYGAMMGLSGKK
ncbi:pathogen-associated molecular patterns-induced protein A70-like [Punica granatum]|uniref:DUF4408 domain-containing protein n=2 Tax=Punica granatum TaxID=22663 RepID=A0A218XPF7_PUNGR|nr:pathogen-associated molecular patterns-induced protein A70-like [Punica granatum]OWM86569.1 hypothetical protein CDL15_Pgr015604 [Punica granatum]PKI36213.1 hypothetical protein CRG98_043409 [Punica granatum]